jgi:hypothetical protein
MRISNRFALGLMLAPVLVGLTVSAQSSRPYRNGSVWSISTIKIKPGMDSAYLEYVATDWKRVQEAGKKEGLILSYKVLVTEAHSATDWDLLLMTEFKDLATMEANQDKAEALAKRLIGDDEKQRQGYRNRAEMREVLGERVAREIILEPKGGTN